LPLCAPPTILCGPPSKVQCIHSRTNTYTHVYTSPQSDTQTDRKTDRQTDTKHRAYAYAHTNTPNTVPVYILTPRV